MDIYIISGLSGAGKSRAAAVLEDFDFYCVDNMPVAMMPKFAELCLATHGRYERVALVTDVRAIADVNEFFSALDDISALGCSYTILFIEANTETIVKRYKETRRRHPLDPDGHDILAAVRYERERMEPVRSRADHIIDTTGLTLGRLQRTLSKIITASSAEQPLSIVFLSFGYKNGIPIDADLVFDVRFLPNPYYVSELKEQNGTDKAVYDYVYSHEISVEFTNRVMELLKFLLPQYIEEGKRSLVVAIGCTGGHHRSVAVAEKLGHDTAELGYPVECRHRDIEK